MAVRVAQVRLAQVEQREHELEDGYVRLDMRVEVRVWVSLKGKCVDSLDLSRAGAVLAYKVG